MIDKVFYGVGYTAQAVRIRSKNVAHSIPGRKLLNRRMQNILEGSESAKVAYVAKRIQKCFKKYPEATEKEMKGHISELSQQISYLGFEDDIFEKAKTAVIQKNAAQNAALAVKGIVEEVTEAATNLLKEVAEETNEAVKETPQQVLESNIVPQKG